MDWDTRHKRQKGWNIASNTGYYQSRVIWDSTKATQVNRAKATRNTKREYLLRGHIKCRQCGHAYVGGITPSGRADSFPKWLSGTIPKSTSLTLPSCQDKLGASIAMKEVIGRWIWKVRPWLPTVVWIAADALAIPGLSLRRQRTWEGSGNLVGRYRSHRYIREDIPNPAFEISKFI